MSEKLCFRIDGEFITQQARDKFYNENNLAAAIKILWGSTVCDEISDAEHLDIVLKILDGRAEIVGTYPEDSYGIREVPSSDEPYVKILNKLNNIAEELNDYREKFSFLSNFLSEHVKVNMDEEYQDYTGKSECIFYAEKEESPETDICENVLLNSFMERQKQDTKDDYGWLEPDGTFHPVEWALHSEWASKYLEEKYPFKENKDTYLLENSDGTISHIVSGDVLVRKFHWVLLHSPWQGIADYQCDPVFGLTKAQKEFLYDYYSKRNQTKRANAIWE